jgi:hypothetical protein
MSFAIVVVVVVVGGVGGVGVATFIHTWQYS